MKVKHAIFLFFTGILIGIGIQSFSKISFKKALISPITESYASKNKITSPLVESSKDGKVLGEKDLSKEKIKFIKSSFKPQSKLKRKHFSVNEKEISEKNKKKEKEDIKISDYKGKIKIAVFGDSMTDLMGTDLPYLRKELEKYYSEAELELFNYGIGAENIEKGLERLDKAYNYQERKYQSILEQNPDIIILDPFVYNPFSNSEAEMNRHWTAMVKIVDKIKSSTESQIMFLATIAPNKKEFGKGPAGINWPEDTAWQHSERIHKYIKNTIKFSEAANLPLINVYEKTLNNNKEGKLKYINPGDHIHQNVAGNELIAKIMADKIIKLGLYKR